MEALIQTLRSLQSSVFVYYTKAHGYHWNVEGVLFDQFHELFADVYNDAWSSVDNYAEWLRVFKQKAVFDIPSLMSSSEIRYDLGLTNNPMEMLQSLQNSNLKIISELKIAFNIANSASEQGVANFFADRLAVHQKYDWKFSASLSTMINN
jgi:starvation-inducible DNA-binding protein